MIIRKLVLAAIVKAGALALFIALAWNSFAAEVMPPKPQRYFNDYAGVTSQQVQQELNRKLEAFEKSDSSQIVVAIFPRMQSDSDIADYTQRVAESWRVGQAGTNNGAVLFVFVNDRKMYLQIGYGLEGAIPDITAKDITEYRIKPHFKNNDYNAGLVAGVDAIIQAARGEYRGTGRTVAEGQSRSRGPNFGFILFLVILFLIIGSMRRRRGYVYRGSGRRGWGGPIIWTGGGSGWGGGGWSSGGGGGGFGGGFSGGGGSFGGGGAGSSW